MAGHAFGTLLSVPSLYEPWPDRWSIDRWGGQVGGMVTILVIGDAAYGDKIEGVIGTLTAVIEAAWHRATRVRLLVAPQAGSLLLKLVTLGAWASLIRSFPLEVVQLVQVSDPLAEAPDLAVFFWDPRRRLPGLVQLVRDAADGGIPLRCFAYTGLRTVGPVDIPSTPTSWIGC